MIVFYAESIIPDFPSYGISIPMRDIRAIKVYNSLTELFPEKRWLCPIHDPEEVSTADIYLAHDEKFVNAYGRVGTVLAAFDKEYWPSEINENLLKALSKNYLKEAFVSYMAMRTSLQTGFCYFLGGGMHHAMSFSGRGFCLVNDIVIGARKLQSEGVVNKVWVIDVDAHKGDGVAQITQKDNRIRTLSIHMKKGWPNYEIITGEEPWAIPSDLDIEIDVTEEPTYNKRLSEGLTYMEEKFGLPELVIVVNGADPYEKDELESSKLLKLTKEQLLERDKILFEFFKNRRIPQTYLMAGGYGEFSHEIYTQFLSHVIKDYKLD